MDLRKIDALIEERIFGNEVDYEFADDPTYGHRVPARCDKYDEWGVLPFYSSDIAAAWEVVEKFEGRVTVYGPGGSYAGGEYRSSAWGCEIAGDFQSEWSDDPEDRTDYVRCFDAPTAPLAICLAALRAMGVEVEA